MIKIAYSDRYVLELPEKHRFPMLKYELLKDQLLYEGTITTDNLHDPGLVEEDVVLLTHTLDYWEKLKCLRLTDREIRKIGFPRSEKLVKRSRSSVMGTVYASMQALEHKIAFNSAGGTHHAYTDRGEGFCLMNDMAVAANYLLSQNLVQKVLIVDLDVHQGNGTAEIFQNKKEVFTFSMHGADNYPLKKEKSDLDIALKTNTDNYTYLTLLKDTLPKLVDSHKPDFIFYQAGVDILHTDKLGKLALTKDGCKERDEIVLGTCLAHDIPVAVSMGGGYSERIADIVDAHCNTYRMAFSML